MSYNGSGTFNINTAGQPVVTGTVISSTAFNALTADLGTGLSTAITKNGQTTVTANIPFNGYKLTGIAVATASGDALSYGQAATVSALTDSALTSGRVPYASTAGLFVDSANLTFNGTTLTAAGFSGPISGVVTSTSITDSGLTSGRVTYATTGGLLTDSANLLYSGTDLTVYGLTVGRGAGAVATNTAVGASALAANTTGAYNQAFGPSSLINNTTGGFNNAFGNSALNNNTTGANNNAFGRSALFSNTTGGSNTGLGEGALALNTTASYNTAVGYQAGYTNSTGTEITVFGYKAGYATTGNYNTYVGSQSGITNSSGVNNTAVGWGAMSSTSTASNNTAIGYGAGSSMTTGAKNTIIGAYSGNQGGLDIRTASNYIVLSDGDGNPRGYFNNVGTFNIGASSGSVSLAITTGGLAYGVTNNHSNATTQFFEDFRYNGTGIGSILGANTSVSYITTSDYRLKENISPMTGALAKVAQLKPVTYKWKIDNSDGQGFIAHELQTVVPDCVKGEKDAVDAEGNPKYQGIDTSFLVATLTAAIQEQQAIIESLKARLDAANL